MRLCLCCILIIALSSCSKKKTFNLIISNVNIVDTEHGQILKNKYLAIKGERIALVSDTEIDSAADIIIDGKGKYLIPGLWDMHAHYCWGHNFTDTILLANGITGVREMFGDMRIVKDIRDSVKSGLLHAPDVYSSGAIIDGYPPVWEGSDTITAPATASGLVKKQIAEGVDFLKVYSRLDAESYQAIAEEAKKKKISFAGHIPFAVSMWEAMDKGQASLEHLYGLLEVCTSEPESLKTFEKEKWPFPKKTEFLVNTFSEKRFDSLLKILAQSNSWVCPTLTALRGGVDSSLKSDPRLKFMAAWLTEYWKNIHLSETAGKEYELKKSLMGKMQKAGVKILAGSDFPNPYCFPGSGLHDELQLLYEGGMSSADALKCATYNAALFCKKEKDFGTVAEGKIASLVLLEKNPLEKISNTRTISAVILRGQVIRSKLD